MRMQSLSQAIIKAFGYIYAPTKLVIMPAFAYFIEKKQDIAHIELRNQGGTFVEDQEVIETKYRIWLLTGRFNHRQLNEWATNMAAGRRANLTATIMQCVYSEHEFTIFTDLEEGAHIVSEDVYDDMYTCMIEHKGGVPDRVNFPVTGQVPP